ncbi:hypothetical protein K431DRAFT_344470 [Polychaeton citri CBS 116435]|uniref:Fucose-specific lectin n=1 Tax=Polychaeton citri CBS 116435 TaxID=1314669 RepID=A0A9P4QDP1_9PEZI|nr:hypothetical protein K431DRAFT_344470 [Polychaeton citri CBS 116435]
MAGSTSARYSPIEHGGLEVAERDDAPEVVPIGRNSNDQPETLHPGQYQDNPGEEYYAPEKSAPSSDGPAYLGTQEKGQQAAATVEPVKAKRRYWGMRLPIFIGVIVLAVVVILGVVLGAALGTTLTKDSKNQQDNGNGNDGNNGTTSSPPPSSSGLNSSDTDTGPLQATSKTGLATATLDDGSGTLLAFYQDPQGNVIQNSYKNGAWSLEDHSKINESIVTDQAALGSPLAAISYTVDSQVYRQVFFFASTGEVMQTNSTDGSTWADPSLITGIISAPGTPALAACAGLAPMNGVRVYFGSNNGYIQEVGHNFTNTTWSDWYGFPDSDGDTGVACSVYETSDGKNMYNNVYYRNTTDNQIHQTYWDYSPGYNSVWYTEFPPASTNYTVKQGSAVAVCNDESHTEYIFWQEQSGNIIRAIVDPSSIGWTQYDSLVQITEDSHFAASYIEGGSMYMFQNSTNASTVFVSDINRSNVTISNIALP